MHRTRLVLALSLALAASTAFAKGDDVSKVNGSVEVAAGQAAGDVSTVNGSVKLADGATLADASTVNGSVKAGNDVTVDAASTVNGSLRFGTGARVKGGLETVNGSIFLDANGQVGRDITTVNGAIGIVRTQVDGKIETVNGDVTVGVGSHVKGGLRVIKPKSNWMPVRTNSRKPRIVIGPDAQVDGTLVFEREVTLYVHETAKTGTITGATAIPFATPTAPRD